MSYHSASNKTKIINFLNALNEIMRDHDMSINFENLGELRSSTLGYLGYLEDNQNNISLDDNVQEPLTSKNYNKDH